MSTSMEMICSAVRRRRRSQLALAALAAVLAVVLALAPASGGSDRTVKIVITLATAAAAVILGRAGLRKVESDPVLRALSDGGREVVWIYIQRHSRFAGSQTGYAALLKLGLSSGAQLSLRVPVKTALEYLRAASDLVPQASVGFDPELQRRFQSSPKSLRSY